MTTQDPGGVPGTQQQPPPAGAPGAPAGYPQAPPPGQAPVPGGPSGPRAGFWQRFGAYLLDIILVGVVSAIISAIVGSTAGNAISLLLGLAYFAYFEGGPTGQTLGKKAVGIRVIDFGPSAGSIGYGRAVIRYLGRIVSGFVIALGYLWMLWDKEKQTWHDKFATSVVVPASAYPPPQT